MSFTRASLVALKVLTLVLSASSFIEERLTRKFWLAREKALQLKPHNSPFRIFLVSRKGDTAGPEFLKLAVKEQASSFNSDGTTAAVAFALALELLLLLAFFSAP